ncbi:MAG TPA: NADH-quinone oxidoreductase subunit C [Actinomycetota bacterium]|nr:NADH-quinone oxidoreductase subunit C [Actinomycetota bacterium]
MLESSDALGQAWVRVAPERYREVIGTLRDDEEFACDYLDFVSAVDRGEDGLDVVVQLYSTARRHHARVKVAAGKEEPAAPTISDLYPGANWHERETWELFGIRFDGHPQLVKLLLPEQFEGHPLRKDFPLTTRLAKPWPGEEKAD